MSNVCMIGHPAPGHVNPTLPVVAELTRRGERVTYFASEPFRAAVQATGARFRSSGAHELFERNLGLAGMLGGMAGLLQTTEEILPAMLAEVRSERPDYLMVEAHAVWGNLLAQIMGIPAITLCSMFALNGRMLNAAGLISHLYGEAPRDLALEGLAALGGYFETARRLRSRYETASPGMIEFLGNPQRLNIVFTSREFQPEGESFDGSYEFVGPQFEGRTESFDFPMERIGSRPLILISMGTMYNDDLRLYRTCFEAFADSACAVALSVGRRIDVSALPEAPRNFIVRPHVPQVALLQRASLFITHGGINSAHEAMLCGVPMLVLPHSADHHIVARQVERAGAGVVVSRTDIPAARLLELATGILANAEFRRRSSAMGATLRKAGGTARAAEAILSFKKTAGID